MNLCSFKWSVSTLFAFSDEEVKKHLSHYMSEARGLRPDADHLLQVCQLFVHCCEVREILVSSERPSLYDSRMVCLNDFGSKLAMRLLVRR